MAEQAARFVARPAGRAGDRWQPVAATGAQRVGILGFPHRSHERFTYVETGPLVENELAWRPRPAGGADGDRYRLPSLAARFVPLVDGFLLPTAVGAPLDEAIAAEPGLVGALARRAAEEKDVFAAVADATAVGGHYYAVADGETAPPVHLLTLATAGRISHSRSVIRAGDASAATLIVTLAGTGGGYQQNGIIDLFVGRHATVNLIVIGDDRPDGRRLLRLRATVGEGGALSLTGVTSGSALSRVAVDVTLDGPRSSVDIASLSALTGAARAHFWGRVAHNAPDTVSRALFRNIVGGAARATVDVTMKVAPGARGSDSRQLNHSLLLSDESRADAKPALMIHNDDVKCSHGATVGRLDEEALLYFRSRGVALGDARRALIAGFAADIVRRIDDTSGRAAAATILAAAMAGEE